MSEPTGYGELYQLLERLENELLELRRADLASLITHARAHAISPPSEFKGESLMAFDRVINSVPGLRHDTLEEIRAMIVKIKEAFRAMGDTLE